MLFSFIEETAEVRRDNRSNILILILIVMIMREHTDLQRRPPERAAAALAPRPERRP